MRIKSYIPITVDIGEAEPLKLGVKRLSLLELIDLRAKYRSVQAMKDEESGDTKWSELLEEAFSKYVRIESEITVELSDGEMKLTKGEQLLTYFGGQPSTLIDIFLQTLAQSTLGYKKKSSSPSPTDSAPSSPGQSLEPPGATQEKTVASAGDETSADVAAVTLQASTQFGWTAQAIEKQGDHSSSDIPVQSLP